MNLPEFLKERRSKAGMQMLSSWVGDDPVRFQEVWEIMESAQAPMDGYVGWLMDHCLTTCPRHLIAYQERAFDLLQKPLHGAIHRSLSKHLSRIKVKEDLEGPLFDWAMNAIGNPQVAIAIRVHSMEIAWQIARPWPELRTELQTVLEAHFADGSAGFKSRGRKILKRIEKQKR